MDARAEQLRWLYLGVRAKTTHGLEPLRRVSVCGSAPAWWRPEPGWLGSGSEAERQHAAQLPRCSRCVRVLAARAARNPVPPPGPGQRPQLEPAVAEFYDWLRANGIDEWIPEDPQVHVASGQLTYTAWQWDGQRGWDTNLIHVGPGGQVSTETRTVPLRSGVTPRIRELARVLPFRLFEGDVW